MTTVSVRYIVNDVGAAKDFYARMLGFEVIAYPGPGFAMLGRGALRLLLNAPGAGGAGTTASDGQAPAPGGWNRFQLEVPDLKAEIERLQELGASFRSEMVVGRGGSQILLMDPSGNLVELFQAA